MVARDQLADYTETKIVLENRESLVVFYQELHKHHPKPAIVTESERVTYAELDQKTKEMKQRIPTRSLIMQFCENTAGSVLGYLGFLSNRIVPILLSRHTDNDYILDLLNIYKPHYLYIPINMRGKFYAYENIYEEYGYCLLKTNFSRNHQLHPELALLMTTSGSTGSPKLIRQSYKNIQVNSKSISQYLELTENEKAFCFLPMHYTYGLSVINSHLLVGATIILTDRSLFESELWNLFKREQATSFSGVPYTFEILKKLRFFQMNLPSLRTITQAGGKLSVQLHQEFGEYAREQQKRFFVMYGQTEATARITYLPYKKTLEKLGSIGRVIPGGKLYLIDSNEQCVDTPDIVGELVYQGQNVALWYAECATDLEKGDEFQGRLKTGDMAKVDKDGYWYIVGRKKRFLKIFGNRVNLDDIERIIQDQFQLIECACVGRDDCINIFVTSKLEKNKTEIKKFLTEKTGLHSSAFFLHFILELPRNENKKIQYFQLESLSVKNYR